MDIELHEINVTLSRDQKEKICNAFIKKEGVAFYLDEDKLYGNDTLLVPEKSIKWDENHLISDEETYPEYKERMKCGNSLSPKTFNEIYYNCFSFVPSMDDKGFKKLRVISPPTINDILEKARKENETFILILNYSLITEKSEEYSIMENLRELMGNEN